MASKALENFEHAIQDARDLLGHFDALNKHPPPPEAEVLKRASLVMALAALETYVEDRIVEAVDAVAAQDPGTGLLSSFSKRGSNSRALQEVSFRGRERRLVLESL